METEIIKVIKKDNLNKLIDSYIEAFKEPPWEDLWQADQVYERLESYLSSPKFYGIMVEVKEGALGGILGNIKIQADGYVFHLEEFFVHPDYQAMGYGKTLYRQMLKDMKKIGVIGVIFTTINNSKAYRMYISQGAFEIYDNICLGHEII